MEPTETPLEHRAHHLAGAIYGTILATTVVAAAGTHPELIDRLILIVAGTSAVFWAAHVYALGLAARVVAGRPLRRAEIVSIAAGEWPMLQSSVPILLALLLGKLGLIEPATAVTVAMIIGIGALFAYGFIIGRREHMDWFHVVANAVIAGAFGLAILALKLFVH